MLGAIGPPISRFMPKALSVLMRLGTLATSSSTTPALPLLQRLCAKTCSQAAESALRLVEVRQTVHCLPTVLCRRGCESYVFPRGGDCCPFHDAGQGVCT